MRWNFGALVFGTVLAAATLMSGTDAQSNPDPGAGTQKVYGNIPSDQIEFLSTPDAIISATSSGSSARIWETLEHGEMIECLKCIPSVEQLLYDTNSETREIAAWWLRKRIFGVFGKGEVYERTLNVLKNDANPTKRAYAAYAVGEFLTLAGVQPLADRIQNDASPQVRSAAVTALGRINDTGGSAMSLAMQDSDARVRVDAITAAGRVNTFTDVPTASKLIGDSNATVRFRGVQLLEGLHAKDTAAGLLTLAQTDSDSKVREASCHALGVVGDSSARTTLEGIAKNDSNQFVRDQARIALRRL